MIKSFRGKLVDGASQTIRLATIRGKTGYVIRKFQVIGNLTGTKTYESTVKIFQYPQETVDGVIDFTNAELLAVNYYLNNPATDNLSEQQIVFDNVKFNQDVFITHNDDHNSPTTADTWANYYIELEQVQLSDDEAAVATLKDMRGTQGPGVTP